MARDQLKWKEYMLEYTKNNPEKIAVIKQRYRENNREVLAMKDRLRRYHLTPEEFDAMLLKQNSRCAICGKEIVPYSKNKGNSAHVDHDEEYGVRGLLCHSCNIGIGNLKHDTFIIQSALKYMHRFM